MKNLIFALLLFVSLGLSGQVMQVAMSQNQFAVCPSQEVSITAVRTSPSNNALDYNGAESQTIPYNAVLDRGNGSFTIEFWVLTETTGTTEYLAVSRNAAAVGWAILKDAQGRIGFVARDGANNANFLFGGPASVSINDANWHHIAVVYDRGLAEVTIYVDGAYDNSDNFTNITGSLDNGAAITLGSGVDPFSGNNVYMVGAIDDFRIWGKAQSSGDVLTYMSTHLNPASFPDLDVYFDFNELVSNQGFEDCASGLVSPAAADSPILTLGYGPSMTFNFAYTWTNTSGNTQNGNNYVKTFNSSDTVIVEVGYCKYYTTDIAFIKVLDCDTVTDPRDVAAVYAPNAFSPNGDTRNDTYLVKANAISYFEMEVYNRFGNILFRSRDINTGWDGTFQDRRCFEGVYTAKIVYRDLDGEEFVKFQKFSLMR